MSLTNNNESTRRLIHAASDGDVNEVRRLVDKEKVDPNFHDRTSFERWAPLHHACYHRRVAVVQYLVGKDQIDIESVDIYGNTPLHVACGVGASSDDVLPTVQCLLETGRSDVNAQTVDGCTPLQLASYHNHLDTIKYLVEQRQAKVDWKDNRGETPIHYAMRGGHKMGIEYLLSQVSSVDEDILALPWTHGRRWDVKDIVLKRFTAGQEGHEELLATRPTHAILQTPLPSTFAVKECIGRYSTSPSTSSLVDSQGRVPIHIALDSRRTAVKCPSIVALLLEREPRSALARDPRTGFYPYEAAAMASDNEKDNRGGGRGDWLNVVYKLFRYNPGHHLRSRGLGDGDFDASQQPQHALLSTATKRPS